ncbi:MAG TPA: FAD-dependent oxidoreductase [Jiangellaceae bacterium]
MRQIDVVVVGGGAMGSAAAWQLARRGADVLLLEQYESGHDRGGSHGSARIVRLAYAEPFYVELAATAMARWDELEDEAGERLVVETGVIDHGDRPTVLALAAAMEAVGHRAEWLSPRAATRRWPGLAFDGDVLFQPRGGRVHADRVVAVLQRLATGHGAQIRHGVRVESVDPLPSGAEVHTAAGTIHAKQVVVAAGPWAPKVLAGIVPLPDLVVCLEQPVHFRPRDWSTPWPSFIHHQQDATTRKGLSPRGAYGLASPDGVKVGLHGVGPEIDPDAGREPDPVAFREVQDYVRRWVPGVDADTAEPAPCPYDNTETSDFVVDRAGDVTVAAGFSGHGFKFTPEIGRMVADLVLTGTPSPERFRLRRS